MIEQDQKEITNARRLTNAGLIGTKLYLILIFTAIPAMAVLGWIKISPLELNQIGDFLAGLFGPLAIFWIVLGFFQQGEELRNSVETLKLQAKELAASVEQQRELVQVTREQLEHERNLISQEKLSRKERIQPNFILDFGMSIELGNRFGKYALTLTNTGGSASKLLVLIFDDIDAILNYKMKYIERGWTSEKIAAFSNRAVPQIDRSLSVQLNYIDDDGDAWEITYSLSTPLSDSGFGSFPIRIVERGVV